VNVEVGDWIRFVSGGIVKIGVVQYARRSRSYPNGMELYTDNGSTDEDLVLEVRKLQPKPIDREPQT